MKILFSCSRTSWAVLRVALWCMFVISGVSAHLASQPSDKPPAAKQDIKRKFDLLPLRFEPNQGQASTDAEFLAQGRGFSALFKQNETDFLFAGHSATGSPLRVTLLNASRNAAVSGEKRLPGTVNYFMGNDRRKWHTGLPTFESIRYAGVYPGTDLIFYGNNGSLEFDFQLSPGALPREIGMRFDCARLLKIDDKGDLVVTADDGHLSFQKPVIYQQSEGGVKDLVSGSFKILREDTVGFAVAEYDHTRPLIIDPILNYSTYIGGYASATSIAVNQNGEAYVAGWTFLNFPITPGGYQPGTLQCSASSHCPFVAKFNSTGTALLYSAILIGSGVNTVGGITLDSNGDALVVGSTNSTDFPITTGAFQTTNSASGTTGFVTELNSSGTSLLYSTYLGGGTSTYINHVAIDASGNAYLTGSTQDTNFPTTQGAYRATALSKETSGSSSGFITKLNPAGTKPVYSTYLGGSQADASSAISVDGSGEAYVGGYTTSNDFPVTAGAIQGVREVSNYQAGFVTKLNASGSALVYSTYLGGKGSDGISSIALDSDGNVYATGGTTSPDFPVTDGAFQPNIGYTSFNYPQVNAFVSELNTTGTSLVYSTFLGGSISLGPLADEGDGASGIVVDEQGMVYLTGEACTGDFPITAGAFEPQNLDGEIDAECTAFLTKMNPAPNTPLLYSTYFGGTGDSDPGDDPVGEAASALAIDPSGNVYLAGSTISVDFPTTAGVFENAFTGPSEKAFVTEFNGSEMEWLPIPTVALTSSTSSVLFGQPVTFTATIQPASGSNTPTGYVGFNFLQKEASDDEGTQIGFGPWTTIALNGSGVATFTTSSLQALQTPVNAFYLGDANNAPASGTMTQSVMDIPTVTTVTSSANNVPYGTPVVFTATVLDNKGKPAVGFVFFSDGDTYAQPTLDSNGQATWTNGTGGPPLPVGTDTVTVQFFPYTGDQKSTGTLAETFTALGTTPAPTFTPPAGTYTSAQDVSLGDSNSAAVVYYTTDGSTPTPGVSPSMLVGYGMTVVVNASGTINAVAVASGYSASDEVSAAYTINLPPPGFTTGQGATTSMNVLPGSTTGNTGVVSVVGTNGFSGTVNLTCGVTTAMTAVNDMPTCSLSPLSVSISGAYTQNSTMTVATTAASSAENRPLILFWVSRGGPALALIFFFGGYRRRRARWAVFGLFTLLLTIGTLACGSGSGGAGGGGGGGGTTIPGTTVGTYTITVTGTSGGISSTVGTVALTVQ